jgi:hypothetical protein
MKRRNAMTTTAHEHAYAVLIYAMNCPPDIQVERIFPDFVQSHRDTFAALIRCNFTEFWFRLDSISQRRYVSDALDMYAKESEDHAGRAFVSDAMDGVKAEAAR